MAEDVWYAVVGVNYPGLKGEERREPGQKCDGLPAKSIPWMRRQGLISQDPKAHLAGPAEPAAIVQDDGTEPGTEAD